MQISVDLHALPEEPPIVQLAHLVLGAADIVGI